MALRFGGFWKMGATSASADPAALARIKQLTIAILGLGDDVTVSANEIICADPACPGAETVVLVMEPGRKTRAYKVTANAADVTEEALRQALLTPPAS